MTNPYQAYDKPGMAIFAGVMAGILGMMNLIYGLLVVLNSEFVVIAEDGLFYMDAKAWGWLLVVFGAVQLAACFGIIAGATWARLVGIAWASIIVVGNMFALPAYPIFSILIIAFAVMVIWSLTGGLGNSE